MSQTHLLSILRGLVCIGVEGFCFVFWNSLNFQISLLSFKYIPPVATFWISSTFILAHVYFSRKWFLDIFIQFTRFKNKNPRWRGGRSMTKVSCRFLALVRYAIPWVLNNGNKTNIPKKWNVHTLHVYELDLTFLYLFEIGFKSISNQFKPNNIKL